LALKRSVVVRKSPTGYGSQTSLFLPYIKQHYPELCCSSFYGLEGAPLTWEGIPVLPGVGGQYGDEQLVQHAKRFFRGDLRGGIVVTLMDVWVLDPQWLGELNAACWVPVDHDPAPPAVTDFFLKSNSVPIAMSRFGESMLSRLDPLYVPHGVDTTVYKPLDRKAVRAEAGVPDDAFLVGMVAANKGRPSRKCFAEALQAFARFAEGHENAHLFMHTIMNGSLAHGENLPALIEACGIPADRVMVADQYRVLFDPFPPSSMAKIYSTLDVLLNPSMGEGFGICPLEAQACGIPVIVTDFSAMREVCGAGWRVRPLENQRSWSGQSSWMVTPDVGEIVSALEECYALNARERATIARSARQHAERYDARLVFGKYMLPALKQVEQRFSHRKPVVIPSRLESVAA
jgi:glycosyltransferase involved in cell wall biosynthesis